MIFQHTWQEVLSGQKTQTRRLVQKGEELFGYRYGSVINCVAKLINERFWRIKWQVGKTYAVQKGRGEKAIARIKITKIELQHLHEITREDAVAEGFGYARVMAREDKDGSPRHHFAAQWNRIHTKKGTQWSDDPMVWVLYFEKVED